MSTYKNMSTYYGVLKKLAEKNINERMPCTGVDKAQQWYSIILSHSYSDIKIFCKDLNWLNNLYILSLLKDYLSNPWKTVKILLKEDSDLSWLDPFIYNDNLQIKIATDSYSKDDAKEFSVADERAFRFEAKPDFGILNFNHRDDSYKLVDAFNQAFAFVKYKDLKKVKNNNE